MTSPCWLWNLTPKPMLSPKRTLTTIITKESLLKYIIFLSYFTGRPRIIFNIQTFMCKTSSFSSSPEWVFVFKLFIRKDPQGKLVKGEEQAWVGSQTRLWFVESTVEGQFCRFYRKIWSAGLAAGIAAPWGWRPQLSHPDWYHWLKSVPEGWMQTQCLLGKVTLRATHRKGVTGDDH